MAKYIVDDSSLTEIATEIRTYSRNVGEMVFPDGFVDGVQAVHIIGHEMGYGDGLVDGEMEGIEQGKQDEYDRFWDAYQDSGNRTNYAYAFAGSGWTDESFRPKHDIVLVGRVWEAGYFLFYNSPITDIVKCLAVNGCTIDASGALGLGYTFESCKSTTIPPLNVASCTDLSRTFYNSKIVRIELTNILATCAFTNTFTNCTSLVELIVSGTIGKTLNLQWSTKLSKASITSVINALSTTTSGLSVTLSKTAVDNAFADEEWVNVDGEPDGGHFENIPGSEAPPWADLVNTRSNWTINLV